MNQAQAHAQAQQDAIVVASQHQACTQRTRTPTGNSTGKRAQGKKFACTHPGCDKRFTRMEHMQRHALNHNTALASTCPRCNAVFKRPDLLERHMNRHDQRDAEAGGPGHGILDTRKRAWKGPNGTVVDKRPRTDAALTTTTTTATATAATAPGQSGLGSREQVVSPPVSDEGRYHAYSFGGELDDDSPVFVDGLEASSSLSHDIAPPYFSHPPIYHDFSLSMIPGPNPRPEYRDESIDYHPAFQPDTASSFNMPYTTALDYNWLFNLETVAASGFGLHAGSALPPDQLVFPGDAGLTHNSTPLTAQQAPQLPSPESQGMGWPSSMAENSPQRHTRNTPSSTTTLSSHCAIAAENQVPLQQGHSRDPPPNTMSREGVSRTRRSRREADQAGTLGLPADNISEEHEHRHWNHEPVVLEHPLSMLQQPDSMPQMRPATRDRLLSVIETANPRIRDQPAGAETRDHPLLSLASLQSWLDLFFTQFNTTYPLIHLSTFDPAGAEPLHLLSMLLLGATYADKSAHQVAVCIHDVMRPSIFSHAGFSASPELWALQTILLVECFGKSRAGQKQHDMSHLFHGLLINLIRRSDCQSVTKMPSPPPADGDASALPRAWRAWAVAEQKKRLALLCFMWDTQHAVLFCQSLCMSAFELRCTLPCDQHLWEAPNAERWAAAWRESCCLSSTLTPSTASGPLLFLPALKAYLIPGPRVSGPTYDAPNVLSLVLVLHGIMSISWDMMRRDQTSLGVSTTLGVGSWRSKLSTAYDTWKVDFDHYCHAAASARSDEATCYRAEWASFHAAYSAVYHAAQTLLHMDFLDVQIYAGARNILGRPVQQRDYLRSSKVVKRWATADRERAALAAYHAAKMLGTVMMTTAGSSSSSGRAAAQRGGTVGDDAALPASRATDTNLFHVPWCLYLATLTCWAFHHANKKPSRGRRRRDGRSTRRDRHGDDDGHHDDSSEDDESDDDASGDDEIVWDVHEEMEALVRDMVGSLGDQDHAAVAVGRVLAGQGRRGTNGLVWVVADVLSKVRWGIVHAGVSVLRGLVPMRLISQYETT